MRAIRTIGYEGASLGDFIATLHAANITLLLDVREFPISRRNGFSKNRLAEHLADEGIEYRHERALGSPKTIRYRLKESGDYDEFFREYDRYLETQSELLSQLAQELSGSVVLLCYERDPDSCHRKSVARALGELTDKKPKHLGVQPQ